MPLEECPGGASELVNQSHRTEMTSLPVTHHTWKAGIQNSLGMLIVPWDGFRTPGFAGTRSEVETGVIDMWDTSGLEGRLARVIKMPSL